jgi:hypothetical protein
MGATEGQARPLVLPLWVGVGSCDPDLEGSHLGVDVEEAAGRVGSRCFAGGIYEEDDGITGGSRLVDVGPDSEKVIDL